MCTAAPVAAGAGVLFRGASVHLACAPPVASPHPSLADVRSQVPRTVPLLPSHRVRAPRGPLRVGPSPCSRYAHEPRSHPAGLVSPGRTWLLRDGLVREVPANHPECPLRHPPTHPPTALARAPRPGGLSGRLGCAVGLGWGRADGPVSRPVSRPAAHNPTRIHP